MPDIRTYYLLLSVYEYIGYKNILYWLVAQVTFVKGHQRNLQQDEDLGDRAEEGWHLLNI